MLKKCVNNLWLSILVLLLVCSAMDVVFAQPLGRYKVDKSALSVSGISSGGYMAQQFHMAYSASVMGAGIIAGGPYYCAQGGAYTALFRCMAVWWGGPPLQHLVQVTRQEATADRIDDVAHLKNDRVYLFSGALDTTVETPVMDALAAYYENFVDKSQILYEKNIPAAHAMVTVDYGNACDQETSPFINDCDYDAAGELLKHIYGLLNSRVPAEGELYGFEQAEFIAHPNKHGLHQQGHAYVPRACKKGASCRLHVAFHGCQQNENFIGDAYYTKSGYNEWAESNHIIVLYPQTEEISLSNPKGCWDWWGYDDTDYYRRSGRQMAAVKAMIDHLASQASEFVCRDFETSTYTHVSAGRAQLCRWGTSACAAGSGEYLGLWNVFNQAAVKETSLASYERGRCD